MEQLPIVDQDTLRATGKVTAILSSQAFSMVNFRGSLIQALGRKGAKVYALAPDFDAYRRGQVTELGGISVDIDLQRTGMNPWRDTVDMFRLAKQLKVLRPDVTLGYFIKPVIFGTLAAWLAGVPQRVALIEGLGYVFTEGVSSRTWPRRALRRMVALLYRLALSKAHQVIFLNPDDAAEFASLGLVKGSKVELLDGIGVDLTRWCQTPAPVSPVTFLLVARLLREKGILEYVDAAREIKREFPGVRFVLLGGTDTNPGALSTDAINRWVVDGLIEWPGHVANVQDWVNASSVFVLPSYREGLPRSTQEAMAVGRPVITTDVPGCRETVVDGVNGFLIPPRDVSALVKAMRRFIIEPAMIAVMGQESRRMAEARFDVREVNARLLAILGIA